MRAKRLVLSISGFFLFMVAWFLFSFFTRPMFPMYRYESSDGGFEGFELQLKGMTLAMVERKFERYKSGTGKSDVRLYRITRRDWTDLRLLDDNLTNRRWKYPYKRPGEVVK